MKRVLVAIAWFVVLSFSGLGAAATAGVIGSAKARHTVHAVRSSQGTADAVSEAVGKYGTAILLGALVLSLVGTATGSLPGARRRQEVAAS